MKKIKVGYFADGEWAHTAFKWLIEEKSIDLKFICLRSKNYDLFLLRQAQKKKIKVFIPKNVNSKNFIDKDIIKNTDLFVSMSYNQIFKKKTISIPNLGVINCHAGDLPFYRGRNPLNWVLINGEKKFGITVHYVDEKIDHGDIILKKNYSISKKDNYGSLLKKAKLECSKLLIKSIKKIISGKVKVIQQDKIDKKGSYFKKRILGDEKIIWNSKAIEIFNFVRGLNPNPLAYSRIEKKKIFIKKIDRIFLKKNSSLKPGVIDKVKKNYFCISCKDKVVKVSEWIYDYQLYEKQVLN